MQTPISISESIGTIEDGTIEVCATADACYDSSRQEVAVVMGAFARRSSADGDGGHVPAPWLPAPQRVSEHLSREEGSTFAKDVFQSWIKKVRSSIPAELNLQH